MEDDQILEFYYKIMKKESVDINEKELLLYVKKKLNDLSFSKKIAIVNDNLSNTRNYEEIQNKINNYQKVYTKNYKINGFIDYRIALIASVFTLIIIILLVFLFIK